jgi:hydroxymethylbilane synthase
MPGRQLPIADRGLRALDGDRLTIDGLVAEPDGSRLLRERIGQRRESVALGTEIAERVLAAGADALLARLRSG